MTQLALDGLHAERDAMLDVLLSLDDGELESVRDVVVHVASTHHRLVEPQLGDWPVVDPVEEFEKYTEQSMRVFAALQQPGRAERAMEMGTFGTHPTDRLADLYLFDMYGHLRADILEPYGPINRPEPPRDKTRLRPTVQWMIDALPWINPNALIVPIRLTLGGPGGGTWTLGTGEPAACVSSNDHDFTVWASGRRPWRDYVKIDGDKDAAARVLDAVRII